MDDPDAPATWKHPTESHMLATSTVRSLTTVRDDPMDACMSKARFDLETWFAPR